MTRDRLDELPELYRRSELALTPPRPGPVERVSGGLPGGITLDEDVVSARADVLSVLASWAGLVAVGPARRDAPARHAVPELCAYLVRHLDWLTGREGAGDLVAEIDALHRALDQVDGQTREHARVLGICLVPGCGAEVRVGPPGAGASPAGCDAGHVTPPRDWLLVSRGGARS